MQQLKRILNDEKELHELVRYIVGGLLTTLLSIVISYGMYMLLSEEHTINGASTSQVTIGNTVSWVICVLFAFWINRRMVFQVEDEAVRSKWRELLEFIAARAISWALLEVGLAALIKMFGVTNFINRIIVLVFVTIFNYVASKFWIFKTKTGTADAPKAETSGETPPK